MVERAINDILIPEINVRLGTHPLRTWYGKGKPVQVACQSVTHFDFSAAAPVVPGSEYGPPQASKPKDEKYWIPPTL